MQLKYEAHNRASGAGSRVRNLNVNPTGENTGHLVEASELVLKEPKVFEHRNQ